MIPENFAHQHIIRAIIFNILCNWIDLFLMVGFLYRDARFILLYYFILGSIDLVLIFAITYFLMIGSLKIKNMVMGNFYIMIFILMCQILGIFYMIHLKDFQISLFSFAYGFLFILSMTLFLSVIFTIYLWFLKCITSCKTPTVF